MKTTHAQDAPRGSHGEHLSREELAHWLDRGEKSQRERIERHLARCDACGDRHRALVEEADRLPHPRRLDVARFTARGLERRGAPAAARGFRRRTVVWASAAAALAASVIVATLVPGLFRDAPSDVFRGGVPLAISPAGDVDGVSRLEWSGSSDEVLLEVFDASRRPIFSARLRGSSVPVEGELASLLSSGETYYWMVTRLDARGGRLESSGLVEFRIREE